jgi:hypothetical protein
MNCRSQINNTTMWDESSPEKVTKPTCHMIASDNEGSFRDQKNHFSKVTTIVSVECNKNLKVKKYEIKIKE